MFRLPSAVAARQQWMIAQPFPFIALNDVIYPEEAATLGAEFPPPDSTGWHTFTGPLEEGKQEGSAVIAGPLVAELHDYLASDEFVSWLRVVSGFTDLIADPERVGGGIHQSGPGGRLCTHVDFVLAPKRLDLMRAVNLILFVGDQEADGGILTLGAPDDPRRVPVHPTPGTLVIFEASDHSWHGHDTPLPEGSPLRKSIPAYYFRPLKDTDRIEQRSTRFWVVEHGSR